ncbi:unnamed protein product [Clonostachys byssicola]|uniref:Uncharacterized protein n=1 Tax=Clonostachys byssicola TaxID=160290 RepID=A0A9N9UEP1_9HYPO|nr:unnamed protein product [Clonostachys byssicola]
MIVSLRTTNQVSNNTSYTADMADLGTIRSAIEATMRDFFLSYEDGSAANSTSPMSRTLTPDCTRTVLPESFFRTRGLGNVFNNAEYEQILVGDITVARMKRHTMSNVVIDSESRKSAATSVLDLEFKDGDATAMELTWTFDFNEDGSAIKRVVEFVDPVALLKLLEKRKAVGV